jgi:16S rRNA A1518/A1519 N6-dimethyltransferase RsmA/KsgA/DIM1 with predicted DNA glycosylase/AP lyase activity
MDASLVWALYVLGSAFIIYFVFGGFWYGAMWMHLPRDRVARMMELGHVVGGKVVYDLGAGYGNVAYAAADCGAGVVAVEADFFKALWIKFQVQRKGIKNLRVIHGNLLNVDLSGADVLLCFLSDRLMDEIAAKPLKRGVVVVSACHKIESKTPVEIDKKGLYPLYVYLL